MSASAPTEKLRLRVSRRDLDFEAEGEKATVLQLYREIFVAGASEADKPAAPSTAKAGAPAPREEPKPSVVQSARAQAKASKTLGADQPFVNSAQPVAALPPAPPRDPDGTAWNDARDDWLRKVYPDLRYRVGEIAAALKVSQAYVYARAGEFKLARGTGAKRRNCLNCFKAFLSEHAGERLCGRCKGQSEGIAT